MSLFGRTLSLVESACAAVLFTAVMYLDIDSGIVRFALRVYFMILLFIIALLGDKCLSLRTKINLLRGRPVTVTSMTGWLRGAQLLKGMYQLRRVPGGMLGGFMLLSAIIALLADLAVSAFVVTSNQQSRCDFTKGLAMNTTTAEYPSMLGTCFLWASVQQVTSIENGGLMGIYKKADNSTSFAADSDDVIGNWTCQYEGTPHVYDTYLDTDEDIGRLLVEQDLLYGTIWNYYNLSNLDSGLPPSWQTLIVSADALGSSTEYEGKAGAFNIKAAVDQIDDSTTNQKYMQPISCKVHDLTTGGEIVNKILAKMNVPVVLDRWIGGIQGKLYDGFDSRSSIDLDNPGGVPLNIAWMLNAMTMVAGATNSVNYTSDQGQGCLKPFTRIPPQVITLLLITTAIGIFFCCYIFWLWLSVHSASKHYDRKAFAQQASPMMGPPGRGVDSKEIRDNTPNGLIDWMQHAVHETGTTDNMPKASQLRKWHFNTAHKQGRGQRLSVMHKSLSASNLNAAYQGAGMGEQGLGVDMGQQSLFRVSMPPQMGLTPPPQYGRNKDYFHVGVHEVR